MVTKWMSKNKPDLIFLAAAKVGGIHANKSFPVNFLEENLLININIIKNAFINGTEKLVNLGSSCIYPKNIMHSIKEDKILSMGNNKKIVKHFSLFRRISVLLSNVTKKTIDISQTGNQKLLFGETK